ncbi:MAG: copper transport protein, partial [Actinomycetota bacterium]|nr:copper transport protein [Actinomycetota bacterium]
DATKWSIIRDVLHTRYGHVAEVRLALLVAALLLLLFLGAVDRIDRPSVGWLAGGALVAIGLAATPGYAGHAATGDFTIFAVPLDTVHVVAMSVWLGGLAVLVVSALGGGFSGGLRRALSTFSRLAFWSVIVLVASGVFASWREVGFTIRGYTGTTYGHLLLIKLGVIVALIALAAVSRSIVRRRESAPLDAPDSAIAAIDERTVVGLRKSVMAEVVFGIAVLALTAMLVNAQPARSALTPTLFSTTISAGTGERAMLISLTVDPARVGPNTIHVFTETTKGEPLNIRDMTAKLVSVDGQTSVPANLVRGGASHFLTSAAIVPTPGKYQMLIEVTQVLGGREVTTAGVVTVPIR